MLDWTGCQVSVPAEGLSLAGVRPGVINTGGKTLFVLQIPEAFIGSVLGRGGRGILDVSI